MGILKTIFFSLLMVFSFPVFSFAATHTAATCENKTGQLDVQTAVGLADDGDTVQLPTCSETTWTTKVTVTKAITIQGNGKTNTFIKYGLTESVSPSAAVALIVYNPGASKADNFRVTGISFNLNAMGVYNKAVYITGNGTGSYATTIIVDNNYFTKGDYVIHTTGHTNGVIYNNEFYNVGICVAHVSDNGYSWDRDITAGTTNTDALFFEGNIRTMDNNFTGSYVRSMGYSANGGRMVYRYNTENSSSFTKGETCSMLDIHGNQSYFTSNNSQRGEPINEFYNNLITAYKATSSGFYYQRSGSVVMHDNSISLSTGSIYTPYAYEDESFNTNMFNPLRTVYPAQDQVVNSFYWNNTCNWSNSSCVGGKLIGMSVSVPSQPFIRVTKEVKFHAPCASGDSTDAYGNTCTHGYNAYTGSRKGGSTSAPTESDTGNTTYTEIGDNAYYPYTPYTCPHPLAGSGSCTASMRGITGYTITGGPPILSSATLAADGVTLSMVFSRAITKTGDGTLTITPSSGTATAAYASGSTSTTLVYTLSRAISSTANGGSLTISYTQGGNDLEATNDGQDVASFPSTSVTNNSEQGNTLKTVTPSVVGTGCHIFPDTPQTIVSGLTTSFTSSADDNYQLSAWGGTCGGTGTTTYTTSAVTTDCTVTVTCTKIAADNKVGTGTPGHKVGAGNPAHKRY